MPIFVILAKFTAEGVKGIKKAPERLKTAQEIAKSVGSEIKGVYDGPILWYDNLPDYIRERLEGGEKKQ